MKTIAILIVAILTVGSIAVPIGILNAQNESESVNMLTEIPEYSEGYGYDSITGIMEDTNGFQYSYQDDGIVKLVLPWGYTTYFSFGLRGDYLGVPQVKTALDYEWTWDTVVGEVLNETGNLTGYSYTFTATNDASNLDWTIAFEFNPNTRMKVTHTLENGYENTLENVEFWYLFDLRGTSTPYIIETTLGITEGPLYQEIPNNVYWVRLSNQFQFNWHDALVKYENGYVYVGDGSVIGLDGLPILGISLEIGSIASGEAITIDPYFSGVEKTWDAAGDASASSPASWSPVGALGAGDNVTFDGTSVTNCDWNVALTIGNFSMLTGYTGTVTQSISFGLVDWYQESGTFTAHNGYTITHYGNHTVTGGTYTNWIANWIFKNDCSVNSVVAILSLTIDNANAVTFYDIIASPNFSFKTLTMAADCTITTSVGETVTWYSDAAPGTWSNLGTINGLGGLIWLLNDADDRTASIGNVECEMSITVASYSATSVNVIITDDIVIGKSFTMESDHATNTLDVNIENYNLAVGEDFTISARATLDSSGTSAVTVGGDWETSLGTYINGDNFVYLTGTTKTLAMHADDSFYNVTVSGSYTMNTDTTVRLRATISGTVDGTGDFIEPLPEFTSTAWLKVCPLTLYDYEVTQTYWDTLSIAEGPYWLDIYDGHIKGIPGENETGLYNISLALTWNDMIVYQNYTLIVCPEEAFVTFEFLMYFAAMLILLVINIVGAVVPQVRILTLFGIFGIAILCVPTALVMIDYGYIALVLILVNIMVPVMSTMDNIKEK